MAQEHLKLGGVQVKTPDSYEVNFATTSTDDSGRNQYMKMKNTPMGTVDSYSITWKYLTPSEMSTILKQVLGKSKFTAHYFDAYTGGWKDAYFYATEFNSPAKSLKDGKETWDELSFNIIGVNPI